MDHKFVDLPPEKGKLDDRYGSDSSKRYSSFPQSRRNDPGPDYFIPLPHQDDAYLRPIHDQDVRRSPVDDGYLRASDTAKKGVDNHGYTRNGTESSRHSDDRASILPNNLPNSSVIYSPGGSYTPSEYQPSGRRPSNEIRSYLRDPGNPYNTRIEQRY